MNGSDHRSSIVTTNIKTPNAITIDHSSMKLYWVDARLDKIERMDFDGQNREIVISAPSNASFWSKAYPAHPFSLTVYNNRLYYSDWIHRSILSVDKLMGNDPTAHRSSMTEQPMGIVIVAENLPTCGSDECTKGTLQCEDRCVLDASGKATCDCFVGRELNSDGLSCKQREETTKECVDKNCQPEQDPCNGFELCQNNGNRFSTLNHTACCSRKPPHSPSPNSTQKTSNNQNL